jgi:hypothetical protein
VRHLLRCIATRRVLVYVPSQDDEHKKNRKRKGMFWRPAKSKDPKNVGIELADKLTWTKESDTSRIAPSSLRSDSESSMAMKSGRKRKLFDVDHLGDRITPEIAIGHIGLRASFGDDHFRCSTSSPAKTQK